MKNNSVKPTLYRQLLSLAVIIFGIIYLGLGIILPRQLLPIYEKSIYTYLKQPLIVTQDDFDDEKLGDNIAYIYITSNNGIISSDNLVKLIRLDVGQVIDKINKEYGKFSYLGQDYYYYTFQNKYVTKIALTNDFYILQMKKDIMNSIFPILIILLIIISLLLIIWSRRLVQKIRYLKHKVDNLSNDEYQEGYKYHADDELLVLSNAIDDMRNNLKEQEEYKNRMYQNISHDFKTPLTVIKSYIEAIEDGYETSEDGFKVIKEQTNKLEAKVHSLLYLNKLNYIKDLNNYHNDKIDITEVINIAIKEFKFQRPDVKFEVIISDNNTIFDGSYDLWEAVIDNLLNNFMRYAKTLVKITIKNEKIIFYNDGPNLDHDVLNNLFTPYKKGIKGQFGLGLSIVKKSIEMVDYEISVKNEKKGVSFIIKKG